MSDSVRLNLHLTPAMDVELGKLAKRLSKETGINHKRPDAARWAIMQAIKKA